MKTEYDFYKERIAELTSALTIVGCALRPVSYADLLNIIHDAKTDYEKYLADLKNDDFDDSLLLIDQNIT